MNRPVDALPTHAKPLVFLDLETTGTRTTRDRITEIAALRVEQGQVVDRWVRLINPQMRIPGQIVSLTGISDGMVAKAPAFADIAEAFVAWLGDARLVAHNARFDHGFLRNECRRVGIPFDAKVICSLRLSRRLAPEHRHHSLEALIKRYGLTHQARHRAEGDAEALLSLWQCWEAEWPADRLNREIDQQLSQPSLPAQLDPGLIQTMPDTPGVYLFYGHNDLPLYVGKSVNLRARVMSHFQGDHRNDREMRLTQQVQRIDWRDTAGDLGAQLLEARLVKTLQPTMNRQLRRMGRLSAWHWPDGSPVPRLIQATELTGEQASHLLGMFRSARDAKQALRQIASDEGLCLRTLGLEAGQGACFASQLGRCRGVCAGKESGSAHERRARDAMARLKVKAWPWQGRIVIGETGPSGQAAWHLVDKWCYQGSAATLHDASQLAPDTAWFDVDTYRILRRFLDTRGEDGLTVVPLE